jgi:oxygen-dependent protoporphyrinogen oxidase
MQHVVVIGGSMAGLAAAEAIVAAAACRVSVVESTGRPGGVIATARRDGWLVERSADSFLAVRPEGMELAHRLGLAAELVGVDPRVRRALIWHAGRAVPAPTGFRLLAPGRVDGILGTPRLSPAGRLRLLAEPFIPTRDPAATDESLESFALRRLGRQAFERLVQPLAAGIWTADPARLSMAAACPDFFAMERTHGSLWAGERARLRQAGAGPAAAGARYGQFVTLADGMEVLPRRLAAVLADRRVAFITAAAGPLARDASGRWLIPLVAAGTALPPLADCGTSLSEQDVRNADRRPSGQRPWRALSTDSWRPMRSSSRCRRRWRRVSSARSMPPLPPIWRRSNTPARRSCRSAFHATASRILSTRRAWWCPGPQGGGRWR